MHEDAPMRSCSEFEPHEATIEETLDLQVLTNDGSEQYVAADEQKIMHAQVSYPFLEGRVHQGLKSIAEAIRYNQATRLARFAGVVLLPITCATAEKIHQKDTPIKPLAAAQALMLSSATDLLANGMAVLGLATFFSPAAVGLLLKSGTVAKRHLLAAEYLGLNDEHDD
jgi:hypothetical protein